MVAGCAGRPAPAPTWLDSRPSVAPLGPGDVLAAVPVGADASVVLLPRSSDEAPQRLFEVDGGVDGLAASPRGRWLAVTVTRGDRHHVLLLSGRDGHAVWTSPPDCRQPAFAPDGRTLVLACPPARGSPASLLELEVATLRPLLLVAPRDRVAPAFDLSDDLRWVERGPSGSLVMRRGEDRSSWVTHELYQDVTRLLPLADGTVVAEVRSPGGHGGLVRLLPSGAIRDERPPAVLSADEVDAAHLRSADGGWVVGWCLEDPCGARRVRSSGELQGTWALPARPTAFALVQGPMARRTEDLATAPRTALARYPASQLRMLGVGVGTALETAWSVLERAGRHPHWIEGGGTRPAGIGIGYAPDGHCVEYRADDRGVVAAIDLRGCAGPWLSPPLRRLLDREHLASQGALSVARRYLGAGQTSSVGGEGDGRVPVDRTEVTFRSERGYLFEAAVEVLDDHVLDGNVRLRLQGPGVRSAARER